MGNRLAIIRRIQQTIEYPEEYADEILWTKEYGYDENFWLRFNHNGKSYALYLKGEEWCASCDYELYLCDGIDNEEPVGETQLIHEFDSHDTSGAMAWAEKWLLEHYCNPAK